MMEQQNNALIERGRELLSALSDRGVPMSPAAWLNTGDNAPVNFQASREVRALHRATVAFSQALNTASNLVEKINKYPATAELDQIRVWRHRFAQRIAAHYIDTVSKNTEAALIWAYKYTDPLGRNDFDKNMSPEDAADAYWTRLSTNGTHRNG